MRLPFHWKSMGSKTTFVWTPMTIIAHTDKNIHFFNIITQTGLERNKGEKLMNNGCTVPLTTTDFNT